MNRFKIKILKLLKFITCLYKIKIILKNKKLLRKKIIRQMKLFKKSKRDYYKCLKIRIYLNKLLRLNYKLMI
jgi:hypothetical protein